MSEYRVLDATASAKQMWHEDMKSVEKAVYADRRELPPGSNPHRENWNVTPTVQCDTRQLPFADEAFELIAFDPPHRIKDGGMSQLSGVIELKYGALSAETWQSDLQRSFKELWRVLQPGGTITFKWADVHKGHDEVLSLLNQTPLYGTTTQKGENETKWWVFHK